MLLVQSPLRFFASLTEIISPHRARKKTPLADRYNTRTSGSCGRVGIHSAESTRDEGLHAAWHFRRKLDATIPIRKYESIKFYVSSWLSSANIPRGETHWSYSSLAFVSLLRRRRQRLPSTRLTVTSNWSRQRIIALLPIRFRCTHYRAK